MLQLSKLSLSSSILTSYFCECPKTNRCSLFCYKLSRLEIYIESYVSKRPARRTPPTMYEYNGMVSFIVSVEIASNYDIIVGLIV